MACPWNIDSGDPDSDTRTVLCRCQECGKFADLECERDFASGEFVVQVMTCVNKGGWQAVRDQP